MAELDDVVDDLTYASEAGGRSLGEKVKNDARQTAMLGRPGPGLRQGLAAGTWLAIAQTGVPIDDLADRMANQAAQGGAELAVGKR